MLSARLPTEEGEPPCLEMHSEKARAKSCSGFRVSCEEFASDHTVSSPDPDFGGTSADRTIYTSIRSSYIYIYIDIYRDNSLLHIFFTLIT